MLSIEHYQTRRPTSSNYCSCKAFLFLADKNIHYALHVIKYHWCNKMLEDDKIVITKLVLIQ